MLTEILTAREPFGPRDSETLLRADPSEYDQLFDRNNGIYAQAFTATPTVVPRSFDARVSV